jgi:hypothetical protein
MREAQCSYAKHLGVAVGDYGATFSWKDEVPTSTRTRPEAERGVCPGCC